MPRSHQPGRGVIAHRQGAYKSGVTPQQPIERRAATILEPCVLRANHAAQDETHLTSGGPLLAQKRVLPLRRWLLCAQDASTIGPHARADSQARHHQPPLSPRRLHGRRIWTEGLRDAVDAVTLRFDCWMCAREGDTLPARRGPAPVECSSPRSPTISYPDFPAAPALSIIVLPV
ncbi:hypothetical protein BC628DRAFT_217040 [Trametes gibbosa]|nr:hypothetical protein BC628DRAFT_217040 [Trametes gibbosa]